MSSRPPAPPDDDKTLPPADAAPADGPPTVRLPHASDTGGPSAPGPAPLPRVPGYEVLAELGRGGMGVVYKARHLALNRLVALKMILGGGHAGAEGLERFRTEAESIARLQHPNIVQVFEIGEHDGLPYFALEFCGGGTLEGRLRGTPLPPDQAAELVAVLAEAMAAAHAAGVIHRDLKPENVLFLKRAETDGAPRTTPRHRPFLPFLSGPTATASPAGLVPKITDFGLAKKLGESGRTQAGSIMGTPSYLAPEQARGDLERLGPATDVYALGAILYECLVGRAPFRGATPLETIIQVEMEEPVSPRRLNPRLPRDLETICLKCLAKDPARRYASAGALTDDLRRFLNGEPITARPVGLPARCWRWCRRNRAVAALLLTLALVLAGAFAGVTTLWLRAERLRRRADEDRAKAEANFRRAHRLVQHFTADVVDSPDLQEPGLEPLRLRLLNSVRGFYEGLVRDWGDDPKLQAERARALYQLARMSNDLDTPAKTLAAAREAADLLERAHAAQPDDDDLLDDLVNAGVFLGAQYRRNDHPDDARRATEEALARAGELNERHAGVPRYQVDLAKCRRGMAHVCERSDPNRAEELYRGALALLEPLARDHADGPAYRRDLAATWTGLGALCDARGQSAEAESACLKAVEIQKRLVGDNPNVALYGSDLARSYGNLGHVHARAGRSADAAAAYREAAAGWRHLTERHPAVPFYPEELGRTYALLSGLARRWWLPPAAADDLADKALTQLRRAETLGYFQDAGRVRRLAADDDFAALRGRPAFRDWLEGLRRRSAPETAGAGRAG